MRAFVVVLGVVDERDLWPYSIGWESNGSTSTVIVAVHDSLELVGVLMGMLARGLDVTSAQLIFGT